MMTMVILINWDGRNGRASAGSQSTKRFRGSFGKFLAKSLVLIRSLLCRIKCLWIWRRTRGPYAFCFSSSAGCPIKYLYARLWIYTSLDHHINKYPRRHIMGAREERTGRHVRRDNRNSCHSIPPFHFTPHPRAAPAVPQVEFTLN